MGNNGAVKRRVITFIAFLFIFSPLKARAADISSLIVKYDSEQTIQAVAHNLGIDEARVSQVYNRNIFVLKDVSFLKRIQLEAKALFNSDIEYVERNVSYRAFAVPNDTHYNEQWGLTRVSAPAGWDVTTGSNSVIIAIVDTGVNATHIDLSSKVLAGYNAITSSPIALGAQSDDNGHGTAVAGVAGAESNNSQGVAGASWGAKLMPIKVLNADGEGVASDVAAGIYYAVDQGAKIINLSLGGEEPSVTLQEAVESAYRAGVVVFAASGNENKAVVSYPARYSSVLAVGGTDANDRRWAEGVGLGSNYGSELDIVAPAKNIYTTGVAGGYVMGTGTSLATPLVSGAAALLLSTCPVCSVDDLTGIITRAVDKVPAMGSNNFTTTYGYGRVNFYKLFISSGTFSAQAVGQTPYPSLAPGQNADIEVKFKNNGTAYWYKNGPTPLLLGTDRLGNESFYSQFNPGTWLSRYRIAKMNRDIVRPGEVATFSFTIRAPDSIGGGDYRFQTRLVAESITWFDNPDINGGAWWQINVPRPQATFVGQSAHSINAWPGEVINMSAAFMNTGSGAWTQGSPPMNLAIDKYQNEAFLSRFSHNWLSPNRIKTLPSPSVAPGQVADFFFQARVPTDLAPGSYRFYVRLVQDGFAWCEPGNNGSAWWQINVPKPTAQHISQSPGPTISRGETTQLSVTFKNTSSVTWKADSLTPVSLAIDKYWASETAWQGEGWLSKNRITSANNIAPGENATFTFNIAVPHTMPSGKHRFYVRLVADNYSWFDNPDINGAAWWEITVP